MGMISACFCVFKKQGTPNDVANVEKLNHFELYILLQLGFTFLTTVYKP